MNSVDRKKNSYNNVIRWDCQFIRKPSERGERELRGRSWNGAHAATEFRLAVLPREGEADGLGGLVLEDGQIHYLIFRATPSLQLRVGP